MTSCCVHTAAIRHTRNTSHAPKKNVHLPLARLTAGITLRHTEDGRWQPRLSWNYAKAYRGNYDIIFNMFARNYNPISINILPEDS